MTPVVSPAYSATAKLPRHYQRQAFTEAAQWFANSHLLVHPSEKLQAVSSPGRRRQETTAPAQPGAPEGDGSLGILEGYASGILCDGNQLRRLPLRTDCNLESAMVLALDSRFNARTSAAPSSPATCWTSSISTPACARARATTRSTAPSA